MSDTKVDGCMAYVLDQPFDAGRCSQWQAGWREEERKCAADPVRKEMQAPIARRVVAARIAKASEKLRKVLASEERKRNALMAKAMSDKNRAEAREKAELKKYHKQSNGAMAKLIRSESKMRAAPWEGRGRH